MNALQIGAIFTSSQLTTINFLSNSYLLDSNLLVVQLSAVESEISRALSFQGGVSHHHYNEKTLKEIAIRKEEIAEFYFHGGRIVVYIDAEPVLNYVSATIHGFQSKSSIDVLSLFCDAKLDYINQIGGNLEMDKAMIPLNEVVNFKFLSLINFSEGKKLMWTAKSKKNVAFSKSVSNGLFICLPSFDSYKEAYTNKPNATSELFNNFLKVLEAYLKVALTMLKPQTGLTR